MASAGWLGHRARSAAAGMARNRSNLLPQVLSASENAEQGGLPLHATGASKLRLGRHRKRFDGSLLGMDWG